MGGGGGATECQAAISHSQKQVTVACGQVAPPLLCPGGTRATSAPPHPQQAALGPESFQTLAESGGRGTGRPEAHPALPSWLLWRWVSSPVTCFRQNPGP